MNGTVFSHNVSSLCGADVLASKVESETSSSIMWCWLVIAGTICFLLSFCCSWFGSCEKLNLCDSAIVNFMYWMIFFIASMVLIENPVDNGYMSTNYDGIIARHVRYACGGYDQFLWIDYDIEKVGVPRFSWFEPVSYVGLILSIVEFGIMFIGKCCIRGVGQGPSAPQREEPVTESEMVSFT